MKIRDRQLMCIGHSGSFWAQCNKPHGPYPCFGAQSETKRNSDSKVFVSGELICFDGAIDDGIAAQAEARLPFKVSLPGVVIINNIMSGRGKLMKSFTQVCAFQVTIMTIGVL
jgi:hypothetical protein